MIMSMILYNIRHNGAYEYEKFTLNIMQISNEIRRLRDNVRHADYKQLKDMISELDSYIRENTGENALSQKLLLLKMELDE